MFSGHESITVQELRDQIVRLPSKAGSEGQVIVDLIGAIMILCNRIGDLQHQLVDRHFDDGEVLRAALPDLIVGEKIVYHGVLHTVIDAGKQGHRIKQVYISGLFREGRPPK